MPRSTLRRALSASAAAALVVGLLPATGAFAAEARDIEANACPPGEVPDPGFSDDDGNFHEDAIHCIVWYDLAAGTTASTYSPERSVTRGQMATFIARLLEAGGVALPSDPPDAFSDDDGTTHEARINQLADLGVVQGTSETTYEPNAAVNRAQMASFLARAYKEIAGAELPAGSDAFTDDDGTFHEDNINRVAEAGIAAGTSATAYSPGNPVRRDQMASFLARETDLLVEEGDIAVPGEQGDNETALGVPELLRAEPVNATTVRFVFDEALNSTVSTAAFGLFSADATRTEASATSRSGTDTVLATFTEDAVTSATLAAVAAGAVQDADANLSIEGNAPLSDVDLAAGTTVAPDLTAVTASTNAAEFTFDEAAWNAEPTGYHLVMNDGTVEDSTAVEEADNGTTKHTATFDLAAEDVANVAYGYVDDGAVSDAETDGNTNVLQEVHVSTSGGTSRPDLTSVTIVDATTVRYVFDENVTRVAAPSPLPVPPPEGNAFRVYFTDGTDATAESAERTANNTFTATFAEGTLNDFVSGAIVDTGTVTGANGVNEAQETGFESSFPAGETAAPELISATIGAGETEGTRVVRYRFDDEVDAIVDGSAFKVYTEDGTEQAFAAAVTFPPADGDCTIDADDATIVECVLADEADPLPEYLVAAVERGAVTSAGDYANAEGAAVLADAA